MIYTIEVIGPLNKSFSWYNMRSTDLEFVRRIADKARRMLGAGFSVNVVGEKAL